MVFQPPSPLEPNRRINAAYVFLGVAAVVLAGYGVQRTMTGRRTRRRLKRTLIQGSDPLDRAETLDEPPS
jgi:hypothetical protein